MVTKRYRDPAVGFKSKGESPNSKTHLKIIGLTDDERRNILHLFVGDKKRFVETPDHKPVWEEVECVVCRSHFMRRWKMRTTKKACSRICGQKLTEFTKQLKREKQWGNLEILKLKNPPSFEAKSGRFKTEPPSSSSKK